MDETVFAAQMKRAFESDEVQKANFCPLSILQEDDKGWRQSQMSFNYPPGIEEFQLTGRGDFHANTALGNDPRAENAGQKLNDWVIQRATELDKKLRDRYQLPDDASEEDVVEKMKNDGSDGARFCALSQDPASDVYENIVRDLLANELTERYFKSTERE